MWVSLRLCCIRLDAKPSIVYKTCKTVGDSPIEDKPDLKFTQRPRELRKPFVAAIVITDVLSERQVSARTGNLSLHGCFVLTPTRLNLGAKVQITMVHADAKVMAMGRVASARTEGMGIAFTKVEQRDQAILERWLGESPAN